MDALWLAVWAVANLTRDHSIDPAVVGDITVYWTQHPAGGWGLWMASEVWSHSLVTEPF